MAIGERVGDYRIVSPVGEGGMGRVFLARHEKTGGHIAIKILPDYLLKTRKHSQHLEHEVSSAKRLNHPNVIDIYGLQLEKGKGYLLMEFMDGGNLREHMQSEDIDVFKALHLILKICAGLQFIHYHRLDKTKFHSIIHRDVKPENILLSKDGNIKVADFGLSLTNTFWALRNWKSRAGTPQYMSPEQIRGEPLDVRTDIYSLGVVMYELLTEQLPYKVQDKKLYMKMVMSRRFNPVRPSHVNKKVAPQIDKLVLKTLEKNLAKRYQTVAEMMLDLQRIAGPPFPDAEPS